MFGNIFAKVSQAEEEVWKKELVLEEENTEEVQLNWSQVQATLLCHLANEETLWKQKARVKWLKEGDSKTKYFHSTCLDKHAHLTIHQIKNPSGVFIEGEDEIGSTVVDFFQSLLAGSSTVDH